MALAGHLSALDSALALPPLAAAAPAFSPFSTTAADELRPRDTATALPDPSENARQNASVSPLMIRPELVRQVAMSPAFARGSHPKMRISMTIEQEDSNFISKL